MLIHRLTERFAISGAPSQEDISRLASEGFRSLIDLRADSEPRPQGLAPWDERTLAADRGLAYRQISVEPPLLDEGLGHSVRLALAQAEQPILMHCTTGRRAAAFGLTVLACDAPLSVDECLQRLREMGFDCDGMPRLTVFLKSYVSRYGIAYRANDAVVTNDTLHLP